MAWLGGCVVESSNDESSCGGATCSVGGYCDRGRCVCESGLVGDPYAAYGCQPPPGTGCPETCGLNAYCDASGECVCATGYDAVCGTADCLATSLLCDGVADCPAGEDEAPSVCADEIDQEWTLIDDCNDGIDVQWRLWSADGTWTWPGGDEVFWSRGYGLLAFESILCFEGETICLGAQADTKTWGVGLDGTVPCEDCCYACGLDRVEFGWLACE